MNRLRRRILAGSVLAVFGAVAGALAPFSAHAQQAAPIKVGLTTDLTGIAAAYARSQVNGVEMAIEELNAAGGVLGRKLQLIVRDSQLKPDLGTSHTRDLITRENVDVLVGPDASSVGLAVSAVARQYKKVVMMTIPNTPRLTMELFHPYIFTLVPSGLMEARAMAEAIGPKFKKFAFIGGDYEASHQGLKYFKDRLGKVNPNAEWVNEAWPKLGEPDFTPYITRLLAAKPDVIFSYLWGADLIGFIKQAKPYGLFERTRLATLLFMDDLKALGQEMPDGIIGQMRAPFFAFTNGAMTSFVKKYRAKYNDVPADWAIMGYEGMQVLAQGIARAGSTDSNAIAAAIEGLNYQGLTGPITFRKVDHQADVASYIGVTAKGDYDFKILKDIDAIPAERTWPTEEEVTASRKSG